MDQIVPDSEPKFIDFGVGAGATKCRCLELEFDIWFPAAQSWFYRPTVFSIMWTCFDLKITLNSHCYIKFVYLRTWLIHKDWKSSRARIFIHSPSQNGVTSEFKYPDIRTVQQKNTVFRPIFRNLAFKLAGLKHSFGFFTLKIFPSVEKYILFHFFVNIFAKFFRLDKCYIRPMPAFWFW